MSTPDEELVVNGGPDLSELDWEDYADLLSEVAEIDAEAKENDQVGH